MNKLSDEVINIIHEKANKIEYGDITISLSEAGNFVGITVSEQLRFYTNRKPRAGEIVARKVIRT